MIGAGSEDAPLAPLWAREHARRHPPRRYRHIWLAAALVATYAGTVLALSWVLARL